MVIDRRQHWTHTQWIEETEYIESVEMTWPAYAASFNNDSACFNAYVTMQSGFARMDGFPELADMMQEAKLH
jgi:hypothetical protein